MDTSQLGCGKTYVCCNYLREMKFEYVYVFCPKILKTKWSSVAKEFGLRLNVFSYTEIIGRD